MENNVSQETIDERIQRGVALGFFNLSDNKSYQGVKDGIELILDLADALNKVNYDGAATGIDNDDISSINKNTDDYIKLAVEAKYKFMREHNNVTPKDILFSVIYGIKEI